MKKVLLSGLLLTAAASMSAQTNSAIADDGTHGYLEALALSPSGKYVCGTTTGAAMFLHDLSTKKTIFKNGPLDEAGDPIDSELRQVNDNGLAAGYWASTPMTIDKDGNETALEEYSEEGYETTAFAVSADGKTIVGAAFVDYSVPLVWVNGKLSKLPMPTDDEAGYTVNGAVAKFVSGDGKVIVGYGEDDMASMPLLVWTLQDDGTYAYDIVSKDYFEPGYGTLPYYLFSPEDISDNGRYIGLYLQRNPDVVYGSEYGESDWDEGTGQFGIYDLQEGKLTVIIPDGNNDIQPGTEMVPCDIANDGTVVGYVGSLYDAEAIPFIYSPANGQPQPFTKAFEGVTDFSTKYSYSIATNISADSKFITGYGYDADAMVYESFVLDVDGNSDGISSAATDSPAGSAAIVARFALDGKRVSAPQRGINIVKRANGRVEKVLVK